MTKLKIVQAGEPVMRERARPLGREEIGGRDIQRLIEAMRETMYDAPGVGLAAPQVGLPLQLAVIEDKPEYMREVRPEVLEERGRRPVPFHVLVNPQLAVERTEEAEFFEGCLSVAGFTAVVRRVLRVRVTCLDHRGRQQTIQAEGWYARILQHEIDHLQGTLYVDRMRARTFMTVENYNRHWKEKPVGEAIRLLGGDLDEKN
jgi:peptide deformylase